MRDPQTSPAPLISVILPCYNTHEYLGEALDSLRAQTFQDFEAVLVDDGSNNPDTVAFLDNLGPDVRMIRQVNMGLPAARNTAFRNARGTYVLPLDCDDWLDPKYLETAYEVLKNSPPKTVVYSHLNAFGDINGVLYKNYNFFEQLFLNQLPYCLLMPKSAWYDLGGYDESMRSGYEDWEFNIRLGRHGYFGVPIDEALFHYRVSESGMLKSISRNKHGWLWGDIQKKNFRAYSISALFKSWWKWRKKSSTYPLGLYFFWILLHRGMPSSVFAYAFAKLLPYSHSARVSQTSS
ncbi:glycosyltransferase family A protein [Magnetovibrio sp. PR-2]|uniref:glycosyltransferase family 2 protein n=1 Tax=Magnetovibrio sp. PR-2 TaxID=3120356 RepID=UPI002FCDF4C9